MPRSGDYEVCPIISVITDRYWLMCQVVHQCLSIVEVFREILMYLSRSDWVSLCIVCRTFKNTTEQLLWRDVDLGFFSMLVTPGLGRTMENVVVRPINTVTIESVLCAAH